MLNQSSINKLDCAKVSTIAANAHWYLVLLVYRANTISVLQSDGTEEHYSADKFVICDRLVLTSQTTSTSYERIYDSDSILSLKHDPQRIIIYGAGVIGCEYASIFRGLGVKTDLINTRDRLLSFLDNETSDALSYHFWNSGVSNS